jgi:hypothetical protein
VIVCIFRGRWIACLLEQRIAVLERFQTHATQSSGYLFITEKKEEKKCLVIIKRILVPASIL